MQYAASNDIKQATLNQWQRKWGQLKPCHGERTHGLIEDKLAFRDNSLNHASHALSDISKVCTTAI